MFVDLLLFSSTLLFTSLLALDYQPPFLTPEGGEIYVAGSNHSCSWNQTFPEGIFSSEVAQTARFLLRYKKSGDVTDYGNTTLATDVQLYPPYPNTLNFTLPSDLEYHSTYFLILLGSTSDESPQFTIAPKLTPTPVGPAHRPFPPGEGPGPASSTRPSTTISASMVTTSGSGRKSSRPGKGKGSGKGKGTGIGMGIGGKGRKGKGFGGSKGNKGKEEGSNVNAYLDELLKVL